MRHKPAFTVVTGTLTFITVVGALAKILTPLIPPPAANRLDGLAGEVLQRAVHQRIDWRTPNIETFAEARRLDMPILFVMMAPWSTLGRRADREIFDNREIQRFLARYFICVRVDLCETPHWRNAFLPFERGELYLSPAMQVWVLDPRGRYVTGINRLSASDPYDSDSFFSSLIVAMRKASEAYNPNDSQSPGMAQRADVGRFEAHVESEPNFSTYLSALQFVGDSSEGGFPWGGVQTVWSHALEFMVETNEIASARSFLDPILRTSIVDWIDDGFFRQALDEYWTRIEYDKSVVMNAEAAVMFARMFQVTGVRAYRAFAQRCVHWIRRLIGTDGLVYACQEGDEDERQRSIRSSFTPIRLRRALPVSSDRDIARSELGLTIETNPQMLPRLRTGIELNPKIVDIERILSALRSEAFTVPVHLSAYGKTDVSGAVAARLMEVGRMLADTSIINAGAAIARRLDDARTENDIVHALGSPLQYSYLGDYLAFADAKLAEYISTGSDTAFFVGLQVFERAIEKFRGVGGFSLNIADASNDDPFPPDTNTPEVVDSPNEALMSIAIRLAFCYGSALAGIRVRQSETRNQYRGLRLRALAELGVRQFAALTGSMAPTAASFFRAALTVRRNTVVFTVGPSALRLATDVASWDSGCPILPAVGKVRPDLQRRGAGIYVVKGSDVIGPLTVEQAVGRIQKLRTESISGLNVRTPNGPFLE